ncbi:MAG: restriction endonuclease [Gemmatimonadota bacterium]|nr:restriction endonuclease [Gemmatimonadota bacterium]
MRPSRLVTCREWEELPAGQLTQADRDRLIHAATKAARRSGLAEDAILKSTEEGLAAQQTVGVLAAPGIAVEILPKVDGPDGAVRAALVQMLAVVRDFDVPTSDLAAMSTQRHNWLELLIELFARRLRTAIRRGLPRRYVRHEEDLAVLRGTLNVKRQFTHLLVRPDLVACRFDELSENTPLNRVCRAAAARLAGMTRSLENHRRLMELLARLDNVADSASPLKEPVSLDRTNVAFHDVYRLARVFLSDPWQDTRSGGTPGFSFLFPMNVLFEEFVGRSLQKALGPGRVRLQGPSRRVLKSETGRHLFGLRPDIVVDARGRPVVLDTKWKNPAGAPSKDDTWQMLVYGQAYRAKRVILVYPWHRGIGDSGIHRRWTVTGADYRLETATVDVGRPETVPQSLLGLFGEQALERPPTALDQADHARSAL